MTNYKFGDVLLLPFPFTNQSTSKQRPAVVVSNDIYNRQKDDIIVIAITSRVKEQLEFGEMPISEWNMAGLLKPSVVKPIITTLEKVLVLRQLGTLQDGDKQELNYLIKNIIGLDINI
jgi:mRNA interferase MazF